MLEQNRMPAADQAPDQQRLVLVTVSGAMSESLAAETEAADGKIAQCIGALADGAVEINVSVHLAPEYIDPKLIAQKFGQWLERYTTAQERLAAARLSKREREITEYLFTGMSNKQIGDKLHIAESTVRGHVSAVLDKLQAPSRAAVVGILCGL